MTHIRDDLFPISLTAASLICLAASVAFSVAPLYWIGLLISTFGAAYAFLHKSHAMTRVAGGFSFAVHLALLVAPILVITIGGMPPQD